MKTFHIKTEYLDDDAFIELGRYHDGSVAIRLLEAQTGQPLAVATVCLSEYNYKPDDGNVFIKTWSENKGILSALQKAGIVGETIRAYPAGFAEAMECKFLIPFDDGRVRLLT